MRNWAQDSTNMIGKALKLQQCISFDLRGMTCQSWYLRHKIVEKWYDMNKMSALTNRISKAQLATKLLLRD